MLVILVFQFPLVAGNPDAKKHEHLFSISLSNVKKYEHLFSISLSDVKKY